MITVGLKAHSGARIPETATRGSFGYDLQTLTFEVIGSRETRVIPTGLSLAEPLPIMRDGGSEGVAMLLLPRSSLALKHGLIVANSPGLIDADYTGDIGIVVHNLKDETVTLERGWRIAQLVFVRLLRPEVVESQESIDREVRGGFGSTGA